MPLPTTIRPQLVILLTALLALSLSGCQALRGPTLRPTPTLLPTREAPTATPVPPVALVDSELLGAPGTVGVCDAPPEATLECQDAGGRPVLAVKSSAATFARWSLRWENAVAPLTGDEVLALELTHDGTLNPNLYVVERSGNRISVPLTKFGFQRGPQTVHIPLREILGPEAPGQPAAVPNFGDINEIQLVFEWADMAGELALHSARFLARWEEPVTVGRSAQDLAAELHVPAGFVVEAIAENLPANTQIKFTPAGDMLVSLQEGRIWWYSDRDQDGNFTRRHLYATGFREVVGLLVDPVDGAVWVGGRGQLIRTLDSDGNGVADQRELRFDGIPWGRHQNNGLAWNPDPDPFTGEAGPHWIYFGVGSTEDLIVGGDLNATILRFPRDGQSAADLEVVSRGNRNAYDVVWAAVPVDLAEPDGPRAWQLFASENGPDFNDAPDEVNHIRWGRDYGFPDQFGPVEEGEDGDVYSGPVYPVTPHASADGLAYVENPAWPDAYRTLYVALFGEVFNPNPVGHLVERIVLREEVLADGSVTYRGEPDDFITGLNRPLPLSLDPGGDLLVGDYATGVIYRVRYGE
jgi:glucose/arabinose dehydrogenase